MKVTIDIDLENNEITDSPWWLIIDPKQIFRVDSMGASEIASTITGPFFSRKAAQRHLDGRRYAFSKNAVVYCHTGCNSLEYKTAIKEAKK